MRVATRILLFFVFVAVFSGCSGETEKSVPTILVDCLNRIVKEPGFIQLLPEIGELEEAELNDQLLKLVESKPEVFNNTQLKLKNRKELNELLELSSRRGVDLSKLTQSVVAYAQSEDDRKDLTSLAYHLLQSELGVIAQM